MFFLKFSYLDFVFFHFPFKYSLNVLFKLTSTQLRICLPLGLRNLFTETWQQMAKDGWWCHQVEAPKPHDWMDKTSLEYQARLLPS